jgi:hypothetical protein
MFVDLGPLISQDPERDWHTLRPAVSTTDINNTLDQERLTHPRGLGFLSIRKAEKMESDMQAERPAENSDMLRVPQCGNSSGSGSLGLLSFFWIRSLNTQIGRQLKFFLMKP